MRPISTINAEKRAPSIVVDSSAFVAQSPVEVHAAAPASTNGTNGTSTLRWPDETPSGRERSDPTVEVPRLKIDPPPTRRPISLHKLIVSAYRVVGFSILTVILVGVASYLTSQLFFLVDRSWISPTIVSPSDERVMQLGAQFAERASQLDKLVADRAALVAQLNDATRTESMQVAFQGAFQQALRADLSGRRAELSAVQQLAGRYRAARHEIETSNEAYAGMSRTRLEQERKAGLIENDQYLNGNYQMAQIAHANLSLVEKESQLTQQANTLRRETDAAAAALPRGANGALSYEMLRIKQELAHSILDKQRASENGRAYKQSVAAMDSVIARYQRLLKGIADSPLLLATEHNLNIAFVPYENLGSVGKEAPIFACRIGMFWCRKVGSVVAILGAEVSSKHPLRSDMLRGQMVHIDLRDSSAAQQKFLFVNRAPLLF